MYIRIAYERDIPEMAKSYVRNFAGSPWFEIHDQAETEAMFREFMSWPDSICIVAFDDPGYLVGGGVSFHGCRKYDVWMKVHKKAAYNLYVAELFIDDSARRRGLCKKIVTETFKRAYELGFRDASVRTSVDQPAIIHLFQDGYGYTVEDRQQVVSTKCIGGEMIDAPDERVIMLGKIPNPNPPMTLAQRVGGCGYLKD